MNDRPQLSKELLEELDNTAAHLLKSSRLTVTEDGKPVPHSLAEQTKAFAEVVKYMEVRDGLGPKEKPKTAFDNVREQFHGVDERRRGPRPRQTRKDRALAGPYGDALRDAIGSDH